MSDSTITVFIVDDHELIIEGLYASLKNETDIKLVGFAQDSATCLKYFEKETADIVLLDINLPDVNGIELCRELVKRKPETRVLGLSSFSQRGYVAKMMESGARGYILKNASSGEIATAIRHVAKGYLFMSKEVGDLLYASSKTENELQELTTREREVLSLIVSGLTNSQIADKLFVSQLTVSSHRRNLMVKLKANNVATLIKIAKDNELI